MTITVQAGGLSKAERRQLLAISTASLRDTMARLARVKAAAQRLADGREREALLERIGIQQMEVRALLSLRVAAFNRERTLEARQQVVLVPFSYDWAWERYLGLARSGPSETSPFSERCRLTAFLIGIASRFYAEARTENLANGFLFPLPQLLTGSAAAQSRRAAPTAAPPSIS